MSSISDAGNEGDKSKNYLHRVDYGHVFHLSGGLYQPRSVEPANEKSGRAQDGAEERPLLIRIETKAAWVSNLISLSAVIISVITLILLGATVYFTKQQWKEANRSARAAESSAQYALYTLGQIQDQTVLMRQQTVGTLGASVIVGSPQPSQLMMDVNQVNREGLTIHFTNVGRVRAKHFEASAAMTQVSLPNLGRMRRPQVQQVSLTDMKPVEQLTIDTPQFRNNEVYITFNMDSITAGDMDLIRDTKEGVQIVGSTHYDDGFDTPITQQFCFFYAVYPRFVSPNNIMQLGPGAKWSLCPDAKANITEIYRQEANHTQPKH